MSATSAMVIAGNDRTIRKAVTNVIHVNTGNRIMVMPGARKLMMVTMKLRDPMTDETPRTCSPMIQRSVDISVVNWLE